MVEKPVVIAIIKDERLLNTRLGTLRAVGVRYHDNLHVAAVSVLWHAASHGRCKALNAFYDNLSEAYKSAFRQYIGRHCGEFKDEGESRVWTGWLKFHKGEFALTEAKETKLAFIVKADALLTAKRFFERDPKTGIEVFLTPDALLKQLGGVLIKVKASVEKGVMDPEMEVIVIDFQKKLADRQAEVIKRQEAAMKAAKANGASKVRTLDAVG